MKTAEELAQDYFEYLDDDLWMEGAWKELSNDIRRERIKRMQAAIDRKPQ